ncbi:MAG: MFS transporter, partial [Planctomycetota bacterium]|jgi:MFS family permease
LVAADSALGFEKVEQERKEVSGVLGNCLRWPFGFCALLAGWLADRYGAKRLLLIYLIGCSAAGLMAAFTPNLALTYVSMFTLGMFASIYHPAGVALISHQTTPKNRTRALGYHGIFGSAGIAAGPFLAGLVLNTADPSWRHYYLVLAIPGVLLAGLLMVRLADGKRLYEPTDPKTPNDDGDDDAHWRSYFTLMLLACLAGFVYAAVLHFLPRYLDKSELNLAGVNDEALRNYLTGGVLLLGIIGQYTAGRIARPTTLEPLTALAFFASAPCVFWMGMAQGTTRILAAALFAPVFFMHQPLYNSLVAKYVPRRRRSLCYGLSFTLGFGVGSFGPNFAGHIQNDLVNHAVLAGLLCGAGTLALVLWRWHGPVFQNSGPD